MTRFSGTTLDWYDDLGATIKDKFPTLDSLPDVIKEANVQPKDQLPSSAFALVVLDQGHVMRKFACADAGTAAMSAIYFVEHGDKLPLEAQKTAAVNITMACLRGGIQPPDQLWKVAGVKDRVSRWLGDVASKAMRGAPSGAISTAKSSPLGSMKSELSGAVSEAGEKLLKKAPAVAGKAGEEATKGSLSVLGDAARTGIRRAAGAAGIGAGTNVLAGGVAASPDSESRSVGALLRRAGYGALGGLVGGGVGSGVGGVRGGAIGAAIGGGASHLLERDKTVTASQNNVIDITGKLAPVKVKVAAPENDEDYAVIMSDGSRHYPINSWDLVKQAEDYFQDNRKIMQADIRRQFAVKLAAKSSLMGYPLDADIQDLGSATYAGPGHLQAAIEMRKVACDPNTNGREWLDGLFEKRSFVTPEVYAECLRRFDVDQGFDGSWGHIVPDPWESTFAKKEASVVWEAGADRVTDDELTNLARNGYGLIKSQFTEDFLDEFQKDPQGVFNSMPAPQKKLLARMANDASRDGRSEFGSTDAEAMGAAGVSKSLSS